MAKDEALEVQIIEIINKINRLFFMLNADLAPTNMVYDIIKKDTDLIIDDLELLKAYCMRNGDILLNKYLNTDIVSNISANYINAIDDNPQIDLSTRDLYYDVIYICTELILIKQVSRKERLTDDVISNQPIIDNYPESLKYFDRAKTKGYIDSNNMFVGTKYQMAYFAELMANKLHFKSKWKPFIELWNYKYLAQTRRESKERFGIVPNQDDIEEIFKD